MSEKKDKKKLNINIIENEDTLILKLNTPINFYNCHILQSRLSPYFKKNLNLIIDFMNCKKIDTSFLALLILSKNYFKSILIKNYNDDIKHILSLYDKVHFDFA